MRIVALAMLLLSPGVYANDNYIPPDGYVPNAETAIKIAVAVWEPIYGAETIAQEKPYHAQLRGKIWRVTSSVRPGWDGGAAEADISKATGQILRVIHNT